MVICYFNKELLQHSKCYHEKVLTNSEFKTGCNNNFLLTIDQIDSNKKLDIDGIHTTACCGYNTWEQCATTMVRAQCGEAGDQMFREFITKTFGTLLHMFCPKDLFPHNSSTCKKIKSTSTRSSNKSRRKLGENLITKYAINFLSFLFPVN